MKKWIFRVIARLLPAGLLAAMLLTCVTGPQLETVPELLPKAQAQESRPLAQNSAQQAQAETLEETPVLGDAGYTDGVYTGTGTGYGGQITVEVTVEGGRIVSIQVLSAPKETESFFNRAKGVIDSIISQQTWEVDGVSGATYSSNGIKAAVQNALTGEKVSGSTAPKTEGNAAGLTQVAFEEPEGGYVDGTYTGSAVGFGGSVVVQVTIVEGKITSIQVVSAAGETPSYFSRAQGVISTILSTQSPNVDAVSGATYSSNGIINAVKNALKQAAGTKEEEPEETVPPKEEIPNYGYPDGVYTGTAEGFGGDVTVQVTVTDGQIVDLTVLSAEEETPAYLTRALTVLEEILTKQTWEVDAVSGATFSSEGLMGAVQAALNPEETPDQPDDPDQPDTPENPDQPDSPDKPENPDQPDQPDQPVNPDHPDTPDQPDKPTDPDEPDNPDQPEDPDQPDPPAEPEEKVETNVYTYTATRTVEPDEYQDFSAYQLTVTVTVTETVTTVTQGDQVTVTTKREITDAAVSMDSDDRSNQRYTDKAWKGMLPGLKSGGTVDAVSGATCSSNAIRSAWTGAMEGVKLGTETTP